MATSAHDVSLGTYSSSATRAKAMGAAPQHAGCRRRSSAIAAGQRLGTATADEGFRSAPPYLSGASHPAMEPGSLPLPRIYSAGECANGATRRKRGSHAVPIASVPVRTPSTMIWLPPAKHRNLWRPPPVPRNKQGPISAT